MAIAFDNSGSGSQFRNGSSSASWSHTLGSGSNRMVLIGGGAIGNAAITMTGATFNGTAATALDTSIPIESNRVEGWFYVLESSLPVAGTYTVTATFSTTNTDVVRGASASYTGVKQTGIPTVKNANHTVGPVSSLTTNVTVVPSNCWLVGFGESQSDLPSVTGGTIRSETPSQDGQILVCDTNGTVSTGSQGMTVNLTTASYVGFFVLAIEPVAATVTPHGAFLMNFL